MTQGQLKLLYEYNYYCNNNDLIKWHDDYQKRKTQKVKIDKKLMPIAWHPSRWWNWCVPEDEKKKIENLWV